jgi:hypothetical protein
MLLIGGAVVVAIAVAVIHRLRVAGGEHAGTHGWMSERWLAEHRATHSA